MCPRANAFNDGYYDPPEDPDEELMPTEEDLQAQLDYERAMDEDQRRLEESLEERRQLADDIALHGNGDDEGPDAGMLWEEDRDFPPMLIDTGRRCS